MNIGDTLTFKLKNGQIRSLILMETDAKVIITNHQELSQPHKGGGTLYHFTCKIKIDGHSMVMERYVGSQESLYEPYVINGMRIWFDGVSAIFDKGIVTEDHGKCKPEKDVRFAITDMTDRICPERVYSFYENRNNFIDITECYNGGYNCWLGAYMGYQAHGGMDIDMPPGTPNFTPIGFDNHYFFNSVLEGYKNNRWRGTREWENGDVWTIQNHHIINLLIPEYSAVKAGVYYAEAAGVNCDRVQHSHFVFRVKSPDNANEILLDPWILFWQAFEDNKNNSGDLKAHISPFEPGTVGEPILFSSKGSIIHNKKSEVTYYWTFGDGGFSNHQSPVYKYSQPGIYPVKLVIDNGGQKATFTQHITIDGAKTEKTAFVLSSPDEPSFHARPVQMMDVYGAKVRNLPHNLFFVARESRPKPNPKMVKLQNVGSGILSEAKFTITYNSKIDWIQIEHKGTGNNQYLWISVNANGIPTGIHRATVDVTIQGSLNEVQSFLVEMNVPTHPPNHWRRKGIQIINQADIRYNRFFRTPYFWVRPQYGNWVEKGYKDDYYFTNGGRSNKGEYARFNPDIEAGVYNVFLAEETPFEPESRALALEGLQPVNPELNPEARFAVRVKSKGKDQVIWMEPSKSRFVGKFEFEEGMDGFVDVLAEGSVGQVLVDAIIFKKIESLF
jgi:PKD repeat protein